LGVILKKGLVGGVSLIRGLFLEELDIIGNFLIGGL